MRDNEGKSTSFHCTNRKYIVTIKISDNIKMVISINGKHNVYSTNNNVNFKAQ